MTTCSDSVENPIVTAGGKTDSGATTTRSRIGENHYGTQFSQRLASSFVNLRQELSAFLVTVGRKPRGSFSGSACTNSRNTASMTRDPRVSWRAWKTSGRWKTAVGVMVKVCLAKQTTFHCKPYVVVPR